MQSVAQANWDRNQQDCSTRFLRLQQGVAISPWTLKRNHSCLATLSMWDMGPLSCSQERSVCWPFMVRNYCLNLKKKIKQSQSLLSFKLSLLLHSSLASPATYHRSLVCVAVFAHTHVCVCVFTYVQDCVCRGQNVFSLFLFIVFRQVLLLNLKLDTRYYIRLG